MSAADEAELLDLYIAELRKWGSRINLVGSTEVQHLRAHVRDALAAAPHLPHGARVVDLGSGAGLPGVPLAVARPDLELVLVEIRERRVHFLRHVVRTLGLACGVERARIESPPAEPYDVALVRALAPPERAVPLAAPWVGPTGEVWIWTRRSPAELGWQRAREVSLGSRGRILRVPAAEVSRGTA